MRIAGFFALVFFFPAFAHADSIPALTTYTVSPDTIYPATSDSGFATTTAIDTAFSEQVKVSIKIVSANGSLIKSLYSSSSVTNPTPKTWDGLNTAGVRVDTGIYTILIMATSTATGLAMSDSSKTITVATPSSSASDSAVSAAATTASANAASPEYIPIPTLRVIVGGNRTVSFGADTAFTAVVYDGKGTKRDDATVAWSFGDGMRRVGASVFHTYYEPGEYLAVVRATTADGGDARYDFIVMAKEAGMQIVSVSPRGMTLANTSTRTVDLSLWRLSMGGKEFQIPADTQILAGRTILFSSRVIELPLAETAMLLYPNREVAAAYPSTHEQPFEMVSSYKKEVDQSSVRHEEASSAVTKTIIQKNEEAVNAPATAPNEVAAAGAAVSAQSVPPPAEDSRAKGLFRSPWTYSLFGVMAMAASAFVFL